MKTIGLLGGMSWESTAVYYRYLNEIARARLGGLGSAKVLLWSFEFSQIARLQAAGDWHALSAQMTNAAVRLQSAGADAVLICANTMHKLADDVAAAVSIPVLHIADATAAAVNGAGCKRPLLLATRFVMEEDFYRDRMRQRHGVEALIPELEERQTLHRIIFEELCQGVISRESKKEFIRIVEHAQNTSGADGAILGCTEFGLLVRQEDFSLPVFDTARLHAEAAMAFALPLSPVAG